MIIYSPYFKKYLEKMMNINRLADINLSAMCISKDDGEGGLLNFKLFLAENMGESYDKSVYKMNVSGQEIYNLFDSELIYSKFSSFQGKVERDRMIELYGKEDYEQNIEDVIEDDAEPLECDYDKKTIIKLAWDEVCKEYAAQVEKATLRMIEEEELDNRYYGLRDENHNPQPVDKGVFKVYDNQGNELMMVVYNEELINNRAAIIKLELSVKENILVSVETVKDWLEKSKGVTEETEVYKTEAACNKEVEDCSLDYVTVYMIPGGKYKVHRQHMY